MTGGLLRFRNGFGFQLVRCGIHQSGILTAGKRLRKKKNVFFYRVLACPVETSVHIQQLAKGGRVRVFLGDYI